MLKIKMTTPIVEMDGDEMTRIIWQGIKDILITPFVELKSEYYDLGLKNRNMTDDQVTVDSANAIKKYGVGVKCATITPNAQRMTEYDLKKMWKSPNGTIRAILDGTVFRAPIMVSGITPYVPTWTSPITIARHAYGDIYKDVEGYVKKGGKCTMVIEDEDGKREIEVFDYSKTGGVALSMHNTDASISSFARSCFNYALSVKQDLWFATKDTISKTYDHRFKDIFNEIYQSEYEKAFKEAGIEYAHRRRGSESREKQRRYDMGMQKLRRRRHERYGRNGVRFSRDDDLGTRFSRRKLRIRSGSRHRNETLLPTS